MKSPEEYMTGYSIRVGNYSSFYVGIVATSFLNIVGPNFAKQSGDLGLSLNPTDRFKPLRWGDTSEISH